MEYIVLRISASTLNTIGAGLQELPYKVAKPALEEIDVQVQAHIKSRDQANDRAKSGEAGNADGDGDGPDRNYIDQGGEAGR